ncbi:uncharacterized protein LOC113562575 [Ooceraea biroi]|uniref:uncharacterized protein LOC113562575 n=1 Tax=Ooceraea biroi TaxID=2015173 RepID=UPI000F08B100|nr:uncharacterized protein LOC113562575 [Ooceraea biroi]
MAEYASLRHMQRCTVPTDVQSASVYLPHHGVLRQQSTTTKLRVVFNGSYRTKSGYSLNDCLHTGPKLQQDLDAVLLRWRVHPYVFAADIEKMYRQILVHPDDQPAQKIIWSEAGPPLEYLLCTVAFGLACSPFLAIRVILQLADDEEHRFPQAAQILRDDMYVDDVLSGADTPERAADKAKQLAQLLIAGGFPLQKWSTNDLTILANIHESSQLDFSNREFNAEARTLGLIWNPNSDTFRFKVSAVVSSSSITKRTILSRISQLFDPLGWLSPITLVGKMLIQQLWKDQIEWDDPVPAAISQKWVSFADNLTTVESYSIPRWLHTHSDSQAIEIHGFSDASHDALGAVVYLRSFSEFSDVNITLLVAKSKVAPLKKQTIPRLELSAAMLLARLISRIRKILLKYQSVPVHLWLDSSVSLAWIRGQPSQWAEFVANRVAVIQELVPDAKWHHVAGTDNPADCASRGLLPLQLLNHELWWHGPAWLKQPSVM